MTLFDEQINEIKELYPSCFKIDLRFDDVKDMMKKKNIAHFLNDDCEADIMFSCSRSDFKTKLFYTELMNLINRFFRSVLRLSHHNKCHLTNDRIMFEVLDDEVDLNRVEEMKEDVKIICSIIECYKNIDEMENEERKCALIVILHICKMLRIWKEVLC